ncbi:MAG: hypothetical protein MJ219_01805 [Mycoplasmoidaceae bacterium]|nr:hypothetical protein [Mycoplasmoidaceae bacterium]
MITKSTTQINEYLKQIIGAEKPDFDQIAYEISSIVEESQQIYKKLTTTVVLKEYASKLIIYSNRYKDFDQLKNGFEKINKLYASRNYSQCIDELLKVIKSAKRIKSNRKKH